MRAGNWPVLPRGGDVPLRRPLTERPRRVPPTGELDAWKERDPIPRLRHELEDAGVAPSALDAVHEEIDALLREIERKGLEAPFPEAGRVREFSG